MIHLPCSSSFLSFFLLLIELSQPHFIKFFMLFGNHGKHDSTNKELESCYSNQSACKQHRRSLCLEKYDCHNHPDQHCTHGKHCYCKTGKELQAYGYDHSLYTEHGKHHAHCLNHSHFFCISAKVPNIRIK